MELNTQIQVIKEAVELIRFALDIKEQYEEVEKLDHVGPSLGQAQANLDELAKRAASFKPQEYVKPPKLDGADVFSTDKQVRERTRNGWDRFLEDDENEIARLKERRSQQQEALDRYRDRENALDKAEKALEKALADKPASGVFKEDLGFAWYDVAVEAKPRMSGIVSDYERIVRDYDRIITRRQVEHEAHVSTGAAVRAMQGSDEAKVDSSDSTNAAKPPVSPGARFNVNTAIKQAVAGPGATPLSQAEASRHSIGKMRDERARAEVQTQQAQRSTRTTTAGPGGAAPSEGGAGNGAGGGGNGAGGRGNGGNADGADLSYIYTYPNKK
ncbi:hypothetical protein [Bradyrhizobium sp. CCBAU 51745]|uniref:hypothetical protein n=1 Tax=Bradyrhizobium sp. CCBAU 51745 TaxID=1325099 RepID=UPI0023055657|nr:hypothetical protein [Bradyrhizobium sp. CCBAU 51745]